MIARTANIQTADEDATVEPGSAAWAKAWSAAER